MKVHRTKSWWLGPLLAGALVLAACEPTDTGQGTVAPGLDTPIGTAVDEPEVGLETPVGGVEEPAAVTSPLLIESNALVGMPVRTPVEGTTTEVSDILVAADGNIAYVLLDSGDILEGQTGQVAVPWSAFQPDPANEALFLNADMNTLQGVVPFEGDMEAAPGLIDAQAMGMPAELDGLIRMGGALQDFELVNDAGEELGEVEQAILNLQTGQVQYAVADVGGFLGLGEHTIAIPWERLQVAPEQADEQGATFLLAGVTAENLENAPAYDASAWTFWPNTTEEGFDATVSNYWTDMETGVVEPGVEPTAAVAADQRLLMPTNNLVGMPIIGAAGEDIADVSSVLVTPDGQAALITFDAGAFLGIDSTTVAVPWGDFSFSIDDEAVLLPYTQEQIDALEEIASEVLETDDGFLDEQEVTEAGLQVDDPSLGLIRMTGALNDFTILGAGGEEVGEVEQAVLDATTGEVLYALSDIGGFLGLGEHTIAIPWERLQVLPDQTVDDIGATFQVDATQEMLENAPEISDTGWNFWPIPADEDFAADVDSVWGVTGEEATEGEAADQRLLMPTNNLVGMSIIGAAGEEISEVNSVLVTPDGQAALILFDAGGFLGIDSTTVAVPWGDFAFSIDDEAIVLPYTQEQVEALEEIASEMLETDDGFLDADEVTAAGLPAEEGAQGLLRMTGALNDFTILGAGGEEVGEVEQAVLDVSSGEVLYALSDIGGFLGLGEHTIAIPWERLQVLPDQTVDDIGATFQVDATQETLENVPAISETGWNFWPTPADEDFDADVETFWETAG